MEDQVVPFEGDTNTGPEQIAIFSLFFSIGLVLVSLRFYVRARIVKKLWWDDFFLLLGILLLVVGLGFNFANIDSGDGRHINYLSLKQIQTILKLDFIELLIFIISSALTKISVCLFLVRIFVSNRKWKRAMYIIIALLVVTNASAFILFVLQCRPIAVRWDPAIEGTCWSFDQNILFYYQGGVSICSDFLLAFLPSYFLKDIQISFRIKLSICALMSLGVLTGICAIVRITFLSEIHSDDFTYSTKNMDIWTGLEVNISTIAATIPALRPLWAQSARHNQKNRVETRRPHNKHRQNTTYVMIGQQVDADSLPSRLETCITAQAGKDQEDVGSEAMLPPDCTVITKTSDISMENLRRFEGKWIPEHSGLSDRERGVDDMV